MNNGSKSNFHKQELMELKEQLTTIKTTSMEACKFFNYLSGKTGNSFATSAGLSTTYWNDLVRGKRPYPSDEFKMRIADVCGLPYDIVGCIFNDKDFKFEDSRQLIINFIEQYYRENYLLYRSK